MRFRYDAPIRLSLDYDSQSSPNFDSSDAEGVRYARQRTKFHLSTRAVTCFLTAAKALASSERNRVCMSSQARSSVGASFAHAAGFR